jgi:excisionase family DNA binding protein
VERLLDPREAAKIVAVTSRTIKEWLRRGELTGVKVKNLWRIRESDLERFIQKGIQETSNSRLKASREGDRSSSREFEKED